AASSTRSSAIIAAALTQAAPAAIAVAAASASNRRVAVSCAACRNERAATACNATRRSGAIMPTVRPVARWARRARGSPPTKKPTCQDADAEDRGERGERMLFGLVDKRVACFLLEAHGIVGHRLGAVAVLGDQVACRLQGVFQGFLAAIQQAVLGAVEGF